MSWSGSKSHIIVFVFTLLNRTIVSITRVLNVYWDIFMRHKNFFVLNQLRRSSGSFSYPWGENLILSHKVIIFSKRNLLKNFQNLIITQPYTLKRNLFYIKSVVTLVLWFFKTQSQIKKYTNKPLLVVL